MKLRALKEIVALITNGQSTTERAPAKVVGPGAPGAQALQTCLAQWAGHVTPTSAASALEAW